VTREPKPRALVVTASGVLRARPTVAGFAFDAIGAGAGLANAARLRCCFGGDPTKPFSNRYEAVRK